MNEGNAAISTQALFLKEPPVAVSMPQAEVSLG